MRSRRLRCQHIPIRRSEAQPSGVARPSPAPRGSETRACSPQRQRGRREHRRISDSPFKFVRPMTPLGSASLRRMGLCLMRGLRPLVDAGRRHRSSTQGVYRRPLFHTPRGSMTCERPNGGRHRGGGAESETPMSEYPHSAQRSAAEWGQATASSPLLAGRRPARTVWRRKRSCLFAAFFVTCSCFDITIIPDP